MIASGVKKLNIPQPKSKIVVTNKNQMEISKSQRLNYEISNQNTEKYLQRINRPMADSRIVEMQNLMKMNSPGMFSIPSLDTQKKTPTPALNSSAEKELLDSPLRPVHEVGQGSPTDKPETVRVPQPNHSGVEPTEFNTKTATPVPVGSTSPSHEPNAEMQHKYANPSPIQLQHNFLQMKVIQSRPQALENKAERSSSLYRNSAAHQVDVQIPS